MTMIARLFLVILGTMLGFLLQANTNAEAHSQSYGYLSVSLDGPSVTGRLEAAVRDLDRLYRLDGNGDGSISWGEFRLREKEVAGAMLKDIALSVPDGPCRLGSLPSLTDSHGGETYIVIPFSSDCSGRSGTFDLDYRMLFSVDAQHRGLVSIATGGDVRNFVATPGASRISLTPDDSGWLEQFLSYAAHGVHHILIGYDHILFVLTLLLGTAVQQRKTSMRVVVDETAKVITAFTLAHSVTLALAVLGFLVIPVTVAESLIAATIAIAAVNNLWPIITRKLWLMALVFGLIHGAGFANVLTDLGLPRGNLLVSLLAFNAGVEAGQLIVVLIAMPVIAVVARQGFGRYALPAANCAIIAAALLWLSDRVLGTGLMPI